VTAFLDRFLAREPYDGWLIPTDCVSASVFIPDCVQCICQCKEERLVFGGIETRWCSGSIFHDDVVVFRRNRPSKYRVLIDGGGVYGYVN
jgi:hypothetical protein